MLLTINFPFVDLRHLTVPDFKPIIAEQWQLPRTHLGHMRGVGQFRPRPLGGFEGWVNENILVFGNNGLSLHLPKAMPALGVDRIRLIRKACYFDGVLNGRFEFLFSLRAAKPITDSEEYHRIVESFCLLRARSRDGNFSGPIIHARSQLRRLWTNATVKRRSGATHYQLAPVGSPIVIIEDGDSRVQTGSPQLTAVTRTTRQIAGSPIETFLLLPSEAGWDTRAGPFRRESRTIRTYLLRMLQDIEAFAMILADGGELDNQRVQATLAAYFSHVNRSRQRLQGQNQDDLVNYCYSAFERLFPGSLESLKHRVEASSMRPQLKRNILGTLEQVMIVQGDYVEGDKVSGNKFGDFDMSGNQGQISFGDNAKMEQHVGVSASELRELAELVRGSDNARAQDDAGHLEKAAKAIEAGKPAEAQSWIKKCGGWIADLAKEAGKVALGAYIKAAMGG